MQRAEGFNIWGVVFLVVILFIVSGACMVVATALRHWIF